MTSISQPLEDFLTLISKRSMLVSESDKANVDVLLTMLGEVDKDIILSRFGIFGMQVKPLQAIAEKYGLSIEQMADIIRKDLRRISITPEWQMMTQRFSPLLKKRLGIA